LRSKTTTPTLKGIIKMKKKREEKKDDKLEGEKM
jgi:hypothetical protein